MNGACRPWLRILEKECRQQGNEQRNDIEKAQKPIAAYDMRTFAAKGVCANGSSADR